jgi:hypothetical protein
MTEVCEHGHQARKCEVCERDKTIRYLHEAIRVLAEEVVAWRAWERSCSAMAVQELNKQDSPELNETADRQWMEAGSCRANATNANYFAAAAVRKASDAGE